MNRCVASRFCASITLVECEAREELRHRNSDILPSLSGAHRILTQRGPSRICRGQGNGSFDKCFSVRCCHISFYGEKEQ